LRLAPRLLGLEAGLELDLGVAGELAVRHGDGALSAVAGQRSLEGGDGR
jgi:hypothetical protein